MAGAGTQLRDRSHLNTDVSRVSITHCRKGKRRRESRRVKCRTGRVLGAEVIDNAQVAAKQYRREQGKLLKKGK